LQRPDRLPRQGSRQSECDGSLLGDFMSNTSTSLHLNAERKVPPPLSSNSNPANATDLSAVAVTSPLTHSSRKLLAVADMPISVRLRSAEVNGGERPSRKECYRLGRRKLLFEKRRQASDYALLFAMIGLLLMVLEQELTMAKVYDKVG
jgi:hypothetical protein